MYDFIKGTVAKKKPLSVIIENNGIGYNLECSINTIEQTNAVGEEDKLFLHQSVSENDLRLFGFKTEKERQLFLKLTSVSRVGPKIGFSVLSTFTTDKMISIIYDRDVNLLKTVPGLGKKSSERLIVELKDKLSDLVSEAEININNSGIQPTSEIYKEAKTALLTLGYKLPKIEKMLTELYKKEDFTSPEALIKLAIKKMYSK